MNKTTAYIHGKLLEAKTHWQPPPVRLLGYVLSFYRKPNGVLYCELCNLPAEAPTIDAPVWQLIQAIENGMNFTESGNDDDSN